MSFLYILCRSSFEPYYICWFISLYIYIYIYIYIYMCVCVCVCVCIKPAHSQRCLATVIFSLMRSSVLIILVCCWCLFIRWILRVGNLDLFLSSFVNDLLIYAAMSCYPCDVLIYSFIFGLRLSGFIILFLLLYLLLCILLLLYLLLLLHNILNLFTASISCFICIF